MIEICYQNKIPCIYNIEDWEKLRTVHRIVGELLGNNFRTPSLPLRLLPEEALFLIDKGLAKLVSYPKLKYNPTESDEYVYTELQAKLLENQKILYKELRKKQVDGIIDKIVEGKRKKGDQRPLQEIFNEELNKACVSQDNMLWPVLMQHTDLINGLPCDISRNELLPETSEIRMKVFADLWEKGFYITAGNKFGGDFLTYLGDPLNYHAVNIVRCIGDVNKGFYPSELVAFGRLGNSVKKNAILAAITEDARVSYITLNWMDS